VLLCNRKDLDLLIFFLDVSLSSVYVYTYIYMFFKVLDLLILFHLLFLRIQIYELQCIISRKIIPYARFMQRSIIYYQKHHINNLLTQYTLEIIITFYLVP